ncbi:MAG: acyltransferase [Bacteroidales bacterium]|nr:acyltransferase [Candidatus Latescibacterota bacterium]
MKRDNNIDMVKGVAIFCVVIAHSLNNVTGNVLPVRYTIFRALAVFMILVGYNGAQSYLRRGWTDLRQMYDLNYLSKKFWRILRPFLLIFIIETIFVLLITPVRIDSWFSIIIIKSFLGGGWGPGSFYIPVIIQCLLILPLLYLLLRKGIARALIMIFIVDVGIEIMLHLYGIEPSLYRLLCFRYLIAISLGVFIVFRPEGNKIFLTLGAMTGFVYILALNTGHAGILEDLNWRIHKAPIYVWDLMLVVIMLKYFSRDDMSWFSRMFRYFGKASYHIFLVQMAYFFIVGITVKHFTGLQVSQDQRFLLINVVLCCVVGALFYRFESGFTLRRSDRS